MQKSKDKFFLRLVTRKPPDVLKNKLSVDSRLLEKEDKSVVANSD